jgi:hypothetical protein
MNTETTQPYGRKVLCVEWDLRYGDLRSYRKLKIESYDVVNNLRHYFMTYPPKMFQTQHMDVKLRLRTFMSSGRKS